MDLYFIYPLGMGMLAFAVQHGLCRRKIHIIMRMLPGLAILAGLIDCAIPFIVNPYSDQLLTVAALLTLGLGLGGMLLGCVAAWVHYAIVRYRQNPEK